MTIRPYTPALNSGASTREIAERVNAILRGKINSLGTITLEENSATTTLSDPAIGLSSLIVLTPQSANAAAAVPWTEIAARGVATIHHADNGQTDRTYGYVVLG